MGVPKHSLRKQPRGFRVTRHFFELFLLSQLHFQVFCIYWLHLVVLQSVFVSLTGFGYLPDQHE